MNGSRPPRTPSSTRRRRDDRGGADALGGEVRGPVREEAVERLVGDQPPVEQRRQPLAGPRNAELREHQRDVAVGPRHARQHAQRAVERFVDETRHLGLVRHVEPGSRSASSGNSRRSERQNASMVLIAMSPSRSRSSCHRARRSPIASAAAPARGGCARASRPPPCA